MDEDIQAQLKQRYQAAVDSFVEKVKPDPNVIAVVISGSLTYDVVWEKSDIDTTLIVRDQPLQQEHYCIVEDGITLSCEVITRSQFKRNIESASARGGSFSQAYYSNAVLAYTADDSLYAYFEDLKNMGQDDIAASAVLIAAELFHYKKKSTKWLMARKEPLYAQYFLAMAADSLAKMELCLRGIPFNRDGIKKALELNPELLRPFYQDALSHTYSEEEIRGALAKLDTYLEQQIEVLQGPVIDFLSDGSIKTVTMINRHFRAWGDSLIYVFDFLAEHGIIQKVSQTIRLTPKSKPNVEEIGYLYTGD